MQPWAEMKGQVRKRVLCGRKIGCISQYASGQLVWVSGLRSGLSLGAWLHLMAIGKESANFSVNIDKLCRVWQSCKGKL